MRANTSPGPMNRFEYYLTILVGILVVGVIACTHPPQQCSPPAAQIQAR